MTLYMLRQWALLWSRTPLWKQNWLGRTYDKRIPDEAAIERVEPRSNRKLASFRSVELGRNSSGGEALQEISKMIATISS